MRQQLVIWFAIFQHLFWGVLLLCSPEPAKVTAIATTYLIFPNRYVLAVLLLFVGLMAFWSMRHRESRPSDLYLAIPQQFFLMTSATGAFLAIATSKFGDGALYSRWFIGADQLPAILLAILHSCCLTRVFAPIIWNKLSFRRAKK